MTSVRTIITDLYSNAAKRMLGAGTLGSIQRLQCATLSEFYRVTEGAHPIVITAGGQPDYNFTMTAAALGVAKGFYLFFEDGWSTVATLTRPQRAVAGGGYSGCLYSVYDAGGGTYKCVHTARPNGAMSDAFVAGIRGYTVRADRWDTPTP